MSVKNSLNGSCENLFSGIAGNDRLNIRWYG